MRNIASIEELHQENEQLKKKLAEYEGMIKELSAPMIPSIVPNTILVPLTGTFSVERFTHIQDKIVGSVVDADADTVIIDLTGINYLDIDTVGYRELSANIKNLTEALKLMGVETIFVGFSAKLVQKLVLSNSGFQGFKSYSTFRSGLKSLLKQKGMEIREIEK
ncbi:STAS domain-containing protein [Terribacillus saccharophilus]